MARTASGRKKYQGMGDYNVPCIPAFLHLCISVLEPPIRSHVAVVRVDTSLRFSGGLRHQTPIPRENRIVWHYSALAQRRVPSRVRHLPKHGATGHALSPARSPSTG